MGWMFLINTCPHLSTAQLHFISLRVMLPPQIFRVHKLSFHFLTPAFRDTACALISHSYCTRPVTMCLDSTRGARCPWSPPTSDPGTALSRTTVPVRQSMYKRPSCAETKKQSKPSADPRLAEILLYSPYLIITIR